MKKLALNCYSIISITWALLNLTFWMFPVILVTLCKLILPSFRKTWSSVINFLYHQGTRLNSFWMLRVIGIRIHVDGAFDDHPAPIIICNHQSWCDIPVIHHVVTDHGPIIKFLIKRQLAWVPVIGWLCWMLEFPLLYRGQGQDSRKKDYNTLRKFSEQAVDNSSAILIFPEGTRFTRTKQAAQHSPYIHLLNPRIGGIRILNEVLDPDTPIIDLTILYAGGNVNFWECLHGKVLDIHVNIKQFRLGDIDHMASWLNNRWQEKDELLEAHNQD